MRKRLFILGLVCLWGIGAWSVRAESPLLFVTSEFPPFVMCGEDRTKGHAGIDVDILSELLERIGQPYTIRCYPAKRALSMLADGEATGGFPVFKTPEREAFALFLESPLRLGQYRLFVKQGHEFSFQTLDDLTEKTIGIQHGHSVSLDFDKAVKEGKLHVQEVATPEQNLRKLLAGRIDGYINNFHVVVYEAKQLGLADQIVALPQPLSEGRPAYLMISKAAAIPDRPRFIQQLNQTLHAMWEDGTVERLTAQYNQ